MKKPVTCPECKGSGIDDSERPAIFVITTDKSGAQTESPCVMCFGHGYIVVVHPETPQELHGESSAPLTAGTDRS